VIACPRCDSEMEFRPASALYLAHFVCSECWLAWHFEWERILTRRGKFRRYLAQGRIPRGERAAA
jgi:hypothetical protein